MEFIAATASFPWPLAGAGTELRLLFENAPVGIAQCDRQGTILAMNPALRAMLAGQLQALEHPRFSEIVSLQDRDLNAGIFRQLMNGERASFQVVTRLGFPESVATWIRWTAWGVCGSAHNPDCVLLLAEDITKIRGQEQGFLEADRLQALGRMAGSITHDFNNLLTGILLYCDLMLSGLSADGPGTDGPCADSSTMIDGGTVDGEAEGGVRARDRLWKYAEEIHSAALQATGVVQQLLNVARPRK